MLIRSSMWSLQPRREQMRTTPPPRTTIGTIGANKLCCWLWIDASSRETGFHLPSLAAGISYGIWDKMTWTPAIAGSRPTWSTVAIQEGV